MKPTKKPLDRFLMIRMKESEFKLLHLAAERYEVSMAEVARAALRAKTKLLLKGSGQPGELS